MVMNLMMHHFTSESNSSKGCECVPQRDTKRHPFSNAVDYAKD